MIEGGLGTLAWKVAEKLFGWANESLLDWLRRRRAQNLVRGSSGRKIAILIARLDGDSETNSYRATIYETIRREFGNTIELSTWPEAFTLGDGHEYDIERRAQEKAQELISSRNCDLLISGRLKDKTILSLRFTVADAAEQDPDSYKLTEMLDLPANFVRDLGAAIAARVLINAASTVEMNGQYLVPLLRSFAERLRPLVERLNPAFDADTRGSMLNSYALVSSTIGEQAGTPEDIEAAIGGYREALKEFTRERAPLAWAAVQNNVGDALRILGERETGTARLEEAAAALHEALKEGTRELAPLQWALAQNNLGNALLALGGRKRDAALMEDAVAAYREALKERTRQRVPLDWAATQNNLGTALRTLGEFVDDTARLEDAVAAFRDALNEYTRERNPVDWAMTQSNLSNAFRALGEHDSGTARLDDAVAAAREALKEYRCERMPFPWAAAQYNLGNALRALGARESGTTRLEEAVASYRDAVTGFEAANAHYQAAVVRKNLADAEALLAERRKEEN